MDDVDDDEGRDDDHDDDDEDHDIGAAVDLPHIYHMRPCWQNTLLLYLQCAEVRERCYLVAAGVDVAPVRCDEEKRGPNVAGDHSGGGARETDHERNLWRQPVEFKRQISHVNISKRKI